LYLYLLNLNYFPYNLPVVGIGFMTSGGAASAIVRLLEIQGKTPFPKRDMLPDQFFIFAGMSIMTGPAGPSFF
jgi:hypothetical protein